LAARLPVLARTSEREDSGVWGGPHWLTVAGAAAGWRGLQSAGHRVPVSPAARDSRADTWRSGILRPHCNSAEPGDVVFFAVVLACHFPDAPPLIGDLTARPSALL